MFDCKVRLIITGIEEKVSKNDKKYKVAYFLGENGKTFSCVVDCDVDEDIRRLDLVEVTFKVLVDRYINLKVIDLKKVE